MKRRWLALTVLVIALTMGLAKASGTNSGLLWTSYAVEQIPPDRVEGDVCASGVVENVNQQWGGGVVADCRSDRVMVRYSGVIQVPSEARFLLFSDDGGSVQIGEQGFGYWADRSCWGTVSDFTIPVGSYPFEEWYYENGGGTCNYLYWSLDGGPWQVVPAEAFSISPPTTPEPQTTTTETPTTTTTTQTTTTSVVESTSSTVSTTVVSSTSISETVPTLPSTTEISTSSTTPPETTNATTTSVVVRETVPTSTTTTTTVNVPTTVHLETTTTVPQPVDVATNPDAVSKLSVEQANAVFDAIDEGSLTDEQGQEIVNAVQNAPVAIRKSFEKHINIFGGHVDNYVPVGSRVTVHQRRIIIAVGLVTAAVAALPRRRND